MYLLIACARRCVYHAAEAARVGVPEVGFKQREALRQCSACMQRLVAKVCCRHLSGELWCGEFKAAAKVAKDTRSLVQYVSPFPHSLLHCCLCAS